MTPYLRRESSRVHYDSGRATECYYCGVTMTRSTIPDNGSGRRRSRDHVLPRAYYELMRPVARLPPEGWNYRACCDRCNRARGRAGHCAGILVIAIEEARRRGEIVEDVVAELLSLGRSKKRAAIDVAARKKRRAYEWVRGFSVDGRPVEYMRARRGLVVTRDVAGEKTRVDEK